MTLRHRLMSNQLWNNVSYVNVEICNAEQRHNVRQRRNNVVIFNVDFYNVDQCRHKVVNMTIFKKLKRAKKYLWVSKKMSHMINNTRFQLWLVKKKGKHGQTYNIKINVGKCNAWCIKKEYENNSMSLLMMR